MVSRQCYSIVLPTSALRMRARHSSETRSRSNVKGAYGITHFLLQMSALFAWYDCLDDSDDICDLKCPRNYRPSLWTLQSVHRRVWMGITTKKPNLMKNSGACETSRSSAAGVSRPLCCTKICRERLSQQHFTVEVAILTLISNPNHQELLINYSISTNTSTNWVPFAESRRVRNLK